MKPCSTQGFRLVKEISNDTNKEYDTLLEKLLAINKKASKDKNFKPHIFKFSQDAKQMWNNVAQTIENELQAGGRFFDFRDHASKLADNIARVAAALHCSDHGFDGEISIDTLKNATYFSFWCSDEFIRLFSKSTKEAVDFDLLCDWFNDKRAAGIRYIPKNFVLQYAPKRMRKRDILNLALNPLIQAGQVKVIQHNRKRVIDLFPQYPTDLNALNYCSAIN